MVFQVGECLSRFMVGAMWLLHKCFTQFRLLKPYMSSPLSSERVVVAKGFCGSRRFVVRHLLHVARTIRSVRKDSHGAEDVLCFAPMDAMLEPDFFLHLTLSSERFAQRETAAILALDFALRQMEEGSTDEKEKQSLLEGMRQEAAELGTGGLQRVALDQALARPLADRSPPPEPARYGGSSRDARRWASPSRSRSPRPRSPRPRSPRPRSPRPRSPRPRSRSPRPRGNLPDRQPAKGSLSSAPPRRASPEAAGRGPSSDGPATTLRRASETDPIAAVADSHKPTPQKGGDSSSSSAGGSAVKPASRRGSTSGKEKRPSPAIVEYTDEAHPPQVDAPWKPVWSRSKAKWYFYNTETDTNSWVLPPAAQK